MKVKSVLKITGSIFAFLISSIIILAFIIDANTFKPRIQAVAAEYGVALDMRGDLHWTYWPALGLAVNEVSIADSDAPQKLIADVKKASLLVAFMPLMRGDVQVKHVLVDGAVINLDVNEKGVGNWENILKKKAAASANEQTNSVQQSTVPATELQLSIEKIGVHDSQVTYTDSSKGSKLALKNINLDMKDVNLNGKPFALDFAWETEFTQTQANAKPLQLKNKLHSELIIGEGLNSFALDKGELQLELHSSATANVTLQYSLKLDDIKNNLRYQGKLVVPALNAKQWLAAFGSAYKTANEKSLTELNFTGDITGDKKQVAFSNLKLQVDNTHLTGSLALTDFTSKAINANLQGDAINVDDYLAPPLPPVTPDASGNAAAPAPAVAVTGDEPLVPVELLRKLNGQAKVAFNSIEFSKMQLEKVLYDLDAKQGIIQQSVNANVYSGSIHAKNTIDARNDKAQLRFETIVKSIDLAPLMKAKGLDKKMQLTGHIHANASGQSTGNTRNQIMDSLNGNFNFTGEQVRIAPLNVEQQFCKAVTMVTQEDLSQTTWNTYTELQKLSGKATIAKRVVTVEDASANVEKLLLGTKGTINLANGSYDFVLPLKLNRDASDSPTSITTSAQGCKVTSNYWVERSLTLLRCKGAYAQMDPAKDCRPDKEQLNGLIKDYAAYKLKEKHGAKIEEKKSELLKKLDEKLGGEGKAEKAKDLLKNLFKKKEDKAQ